MYNIYGLKWCIYCLRVINLMQEKGLEFHYYPMDNQEQILNSIKEEYKINNLCLAGGVALNCVANGKILKNSSAISLKV